MTALLSVEAAQARLLAPAVPLPPSRRSLAAAHRHFLAEPLIALRTQPEAPLSAMDGYAVRFADLPGPWRVIEHIAAGSVGGLSVGAGEAARIFTGAPLPPGADTVLVQEDAASNAAIVTLTGTGPAQAGQHVRGAGGDFMRGEQIAASGSPVTPGIIALAAMAGHANLLVGGTARVAIITTGDELADPGAALAPGQIPDSNGVMLAAKLASWPAVLGQAIRIGDKLDVTIAALRDASAAHDVIITIGGASVGDHDHIHAALTSLGAPPAFWKVAMRPGKPLLAARLGRAVVLGLPGNPASAFVTATLFAAPLLRHLAGAADPLPPVAHAPLAVDLGPGGARRDYLRAVLAGGALTPCPNQDSGFVTALAQANALLIREAGAAPQSAGTIVPYLAV